MKANELMIGDWVKVTHLNRIGKAYRIDRANGEGNGWVAVFDGDFHESLLEPVPLTPEILEKNGFEQFEEDNYICKKSDKEDDYSIVVDLLVPYLSYIRKDKMPKASYGGEIKCVHQLQHALRLCGINHEIIL